MTIKVQKKSCINCKHLQYEDGDGYESYDDSGYACAGRGYNSNDEELKHLKVLQIDSYLSKGKRCHKQKGKRP